MNIEANHALLAAHTFEHELRISAINGMLGSIDANQGDPVLGWDTDEFPFDVYSATMCMYEVLKAGGLGNGGLNFDAKNRRPSNTAEDMVEAFILGMDTFALGLMKAAAIIEDGRLDEFKAERYSSFNSGIGKKIIDNETNLEELFNYACELGKCTDPGSGKQEHLQTVVNSIMFGE